MKSDALFTLLILPVIWGCYYVASNVAVGQMSVFSVGIVIRFGTMILLTIMMLKRGQLRTLLEIKHIWPRLITIGTLGFLLDVTAFIGLTLCPAGIGTVLLKSDILFVNLISCLFYHYRFTKKEWAYTILMLVGVAMIMRMDVTQITSGGFGNIFFILSALFVSINAFVIKSVQHDERNPASDNVVAYFNNLITMCYFTVFAVATGDITQLQKLGYGGGLTVALLVATLGQTLVYVVYYYNLRRYPVWLVKVFLLIMPIVSSVISYFLFDERMTNTQLVGVGVVLLGAAGIFLEQGMKNQCASVSSK